MIERHGSLLMSVFLLICTTFTVTKVLTVIKNEALQLKKKIICYDFFEKDMTSSSVMILMKCVIWSYRQHNKLKVENPTPQDFDYYFFVFT